MNWKNTIGYRSLCLFFILLMNVSCAKKTLIEDLSSIDSVTIKFNMADIEFEMSKISSLKKITPISSERRTLSYNKDYDLVVDIVTKTNLPEYRNKIGSSNPTPMEDNITFLVLAFDKSTGDFITSKHYNKNHPTDNVMKLPAGREYKFIGVTDNLQNTRWRPLIREYGFEFTNGVKKLNSCFYNGRLLSNDSLFISGLQPLTPRYPVYYAVVDDLGELTSGINYTKDIVFRPVHYSMKVRVDISPDITSSHDRSDVFLGTFQSDKIVRGDNMKVSLLNGKIDPQSGDLGYQDGVGDFGYDTVNDTFLGLAYLTEADNNGVLNFSININNERRSFSMPNINLVPGNTYEVTISMVKPTP